MHSFMIYDTKENIRYIKDNENNIYRVITYKSGTNILFIRMINRSNAVDILNNINTKTIEDLEQRYTIEVVSPEEKESPEEWLSRHENEFLKRCDSEDESLRCKTLSINHINHQLRRRQKVLDKITDICLNDNSKKIRKRAYKAYCQIILRKDREGFAEKYVNGLKDFKK